MALMGDENASMSYPTTIYEKKDVWCIGKAVYSQVIDYICIES